MDGYQGTSCESLSEAEVRYNTRLTHYLVSKGKQVGWQKERDCIEQLGNWG